MKTAATNKAKVTSCNKATNPKMVTKDRILVTNQSSNTRILGTINIQTTTNNLIAPKTIAPSTTSKMPGKENATKKANIEAITTSK